MKEDNRKIETAIFAAGCFWGVEELFRATKGVLKTTVGYTGGHTKQPSYETVCSDQTGHAEAVKIDFDSQMIAYKKLLDIFWQNHNPTTYNRRGPDIGSQYRSAIFYSTDQQKQLAEKSKKLLEQSKKYTNKIITKILPAAKFYPAEEYHQKYLYKKGLKNCHL
ncbi:MAG: peptide-methionine (S)-S-oxide reductase [Candidatus Komeilibacteria bacterium CG11_big_fil_rev_8_21_14_0_20_36_20]|uniref:Peptide methionine sulfoxide reductase MsrA n=1 Tax=Candidatus Komeilibacteria bacterium CG11_big_fil_rev_8_21_14_0_20_36_20 TaxID=1974477 RepID=A0A2H0NCA9_9BACT|nr:MAG: peptide-methionine (S)-S-oxide reductase [Candidatus Komeilibacteria bacterium CG11_big_fil_rev_8_21_14_0_20_36_20]PIR81623.1 MAG: peptide-methionine (S)-S-oxide reductase [Candidatus Komeilibacteria bacterium CG10_big_fil_rev_8_21_14_0_10_36_65]PJC55629.1 MAG: peptide-methionine (S)-S-oxide reductase [Candidatus Komeilibacteria bacterium CG_4_9_14_0_2_um_filter_36_13]